MLIIYSITVILWTLILLAALFSPTSKYISERVFTLLIIIGIIPIVNTIFLVWSIFSTLTSLKSEEQKEQEFKESAEYVDEFLKRLKNKFKNNG